MLPVEVYNELMERRGSAVAQADASLRAEGREPPRETEFIVDRWVRGEITSGEMERQIAELYGLRDG